VAQALDIPLMLTLVRDTYRAGDGIDDLLDTGRFGDRRPGKITYLTGSCPRRTY
jgi:hypothetical protein